MCIYYLKNEKSMNHSKYQVHELVQIWTKAIIVPGVNPAIRRKDICGASIDWAAYGDRQSPVGWEVDHYIAQANGGAHHIGNLHPLHWKNNCAKSDGRIVCAVTDRG